MSFEEKLFLVLLILTVGAVMLLISAPAIVEDGHIPWHPDSVLHIVTRLMNFDSMFPTSKGITVKQLAYGLGTSAALILAAIAWYRRETARASLPLPTGGEGPDAAKPNWHERLTPADGAQLALLALVLWSFLSAIWSQWPAVACGESALLAMGAVWAVSLGRSLRRQTAVMGIITLIGILTLTACIGIWYYYERNPHQRLKFPVGNPLFLAACLMPAMLMAVHVAIGAAVSAVQNRKWSGLILTLAMLAVLVPLTKAFLLTGSRGATVGLAAGVFVTLFAKLKSRRSHDVTLVLRVMVVSALLVSLYMGYRYLQNHVNDLENGRGATIRLRMYGWKYAWQLFQHQPILGAGNGGFKLTSDALTQQDARMDPLAFTADRMGGAHNEWLELLANLGAVGFALFILVYGLTLWEGRKAMHDLTDGLQHWCFVGLLASLLALMVEESVNVAMSMPGLPVVWYTILGLLWAFMRHPKEPHTSAASIAESGRSLLAGLAIVTAAVLALWSIGNWRGALAQARIPTLLEQQKWSEAETHAQQAVRFRLAADEVMDSALMKFNSHAEIALFHLDAALENAAAPPNAPPSRKLTDLQMQDLDIGRTHATSARNDAIHILSAVPEFPSVAGNMSHLLFTWLNTEQQLGTEMPEEYSNRLHQEAKTLILREFQRDPLNPVAAMAAVRAWPDAPISDRIDWLRIALRGGIIPDGYRDLITAMSNDKDFSPAFQERLQAATANVTAERAQDWLEPYAPETLRMLAILYAANGDQAEAAKAAGAAARLYQQIYTAFPTLASIAMAEQANYQFNADPDQPELAQQLCRHALAAVPPLGSRDRLQQPIREALSAYLLAAGDENSAAAIIMELTGNKDPYAAMKQVGARYSQLAMMYGGVAPEYRPTRYPLWRSRAISLLSETGASQILRAQEAFETRRDTDVVDAWLKAESLGANPEFIDNMLAHALAQRPEIEAYRKLAAQRGVQPATRPAETRPVAASQPATTRTTTTKASQE